MTGDSNRDPLSGSPEWWAIEEKRRHKENLARISAPEMGGAAIKQQALFPQNAQFTATAEAIEIARREVDSAQMLATIGSAPSSFAAAVQGCLGKQSLAEQFKCQQENEIKHWQELANAYSVADMVRRDVALAEEQAKQPWRITSESYTPAASSMIHEEAMRIAAGLDQTSIQAYLGNARSLVEAENERYLESIYALVSPSAASWEAQVRDDLLSAGLGARIPWGVLSGTITHDLVLQQVRELYEPDYYARNFLDTIKVAGQSNSIIAEAIRATKSLRFGDYLASLDDDTVEELISSEEREEEAREAVRAKLQEAATDPAVASSPETASDLNKMLALYEAHGSFDAAIKAELQKELANRQSEIAKLPRDRKRDEGGASFLCQAVKQKSKKHKPHTAWSWMQGAASYGVFLGFEIISCSEENVEYRYNGQNRNPIRRSTFDRFFRSPRPDSHKK